MKIAIEEITELDSDMNNQLMKIMGVVIIKLIYTIEYNKDIDLKPNIYYFIQDYLERNYSVNISNNLIMMNSIIENCIIAASLFIYNNLK